MFQNPLSAVNILKEKFAAFVLAAKIATDNKINNPDTAVVETKNEK